MRAIAVLLAIFLLIGVVSSSVITNVYYSDSKCTQEIGTDVVEITSGQCEPADEDGTFSTKMKVKGKKVEVWYVII